MMRSFIFLSLLSLPCYDLSAGLVGPSKPVGRDDPFEVVRGVPPISQPSTSVSAQYWHDLYNSTIGRTQPATNHMETEPVASSQVYAIPLPEKKFQHEIAFDNEVSHRAGDVPDGYSYASSSTDPFAGLEFDGILGCAVPLPDLTRMSVKELERYLREFLTPVGSIGRKLMAMGRINPNLANRILSDLHAFYGGRVHSILDKPQEIHAFVLSLEKWELYLSQFQVADSQGIEPVISPLWRLPQYKSLFTSPNLSFLTQVKLMNISTPAVLDEALRGVALREDRELKVMTGDLQKLDLQGGKRPAEVEVPGSADTKGRRKKKKPYR